jgi:hypothetical protein
MTSRPLTAPTPGSASAADELANGVGGEPLSAIGENYDLPTRIRHAEVQRPCLALRVAAHEDIHPWLTLSDPLGGRHCAVRACIADDQNVQPLVRVILGEKVLDATGQRVLLIAGSEHHGHGRLQACPHTGRGV